MGMRRETRKTKKSKNAISSLLDVTAPEGSGVIVEEIKTVVEVKKDIPILKDQERSLTVSDIQAIQLEYEKKLKLLTDKCSRLEEGVAPLGRTEEKILSAIRSEAITQDSDFPVISTRSFLSKHKVSSRFFYKKRDEMIESGLIERERTTYSGKISTFRYKVL